MEEGLDFLLSQVQIDQCPRGGGAGLPARSDTNEKAIKNILALNFRFLCCFFVSIFFVKAPFIIKSRITKT